MRYKLIKHRSPVIWIKWSNGYEITWPGQVSENEIVWGYLVMFNLRYEPLCAILLFTQHIWGCDERNVWIWTWTLTSLLWQALRVGPSTRWITLYKPNTKCWGICDDCGYTFMFDVDDIICWNTLELNDYHVTPN